MSYPVIERLTDAGADVEEALERRFMNDAETYIECLNDFVEDPSMKNLAEAVENKNEEAAVRAVHTLKGLADSLGFLDLLDESADMLKALRGGRVEEGYAALPRVRKAFNEIVAIIRVTETDTEKCYDGTEIHNARC